MNIIKPKYRLRLWSRCEVRPTGCWEWTGTKKPSGYGLMSVNGRYFRVHRLAYLAARGPFNEELHVLHSCDNPSCINPDHLSLGTHQENMDDMRSKGRGLKGEQIPVAVLTADIVRTIRSEKLSGRTYRDIAAELSIEESTVRKAGNGTTWRHIDGPTPEKAHTPTVKTAGSLPHAGTEGDTPDASK